MIFKCPGQDDRNLKAETLSCAGCGYQIEIFSDEIKVYCPKCKNLVYRQRLPSCVDWCKSARECIGGEHGLYMEEQYMGLMKIIFNERVKRTPTVESFRFLPKEKFDFMPGQFLRVIFDEKNPDSKELNKYLSFSSSPAKDYIEVTKRLSESRFSRKLKDLKSNDTVLIKAPLGSCVFKEDYKKITFLIGGIGITPVVSIIGYIIDKNLTTDVLLFYSNRTVEEIAFKKELDDWQKVNPHIKVFYAITDCQPKDKSFIFGHINKELLSEEIKDLQERIFFIFGPPKMVEAMNVLCLELGCRKENIKRESFIGY